MKNLIDFVKKNAKTVNAVVFAIILITLLITGLISCTSKIYTKENLQVFHVTAAGDTTKLHWEDVEVIDAADNKTILIFKER